MLGVEPELPAGDCVRLPVAAIGLVMSLDEIVRTRISEPFFTARPLVGQRGGIA